MCVCVCVWEDVLGGVWVCRARCIRRYTHTHTHTHTHTYTTHTHTRLPAQSLYTQDRGGGPRNAPKLGPDFERARQCHGVSWTVTHVLVKFYCQWMTDGYILLPGRNWKMNKNCASSLGTFLHLSLPFFSLSLRQLENFPKLRLASLSLSFSHCANCVRKLSSSVPHSLSPCSAAQAPPLFCLSCIRDYENCVCMDGNPRTDVNNLIFRIILLCFILFFSSI